jgi:hypothetical protein
MPAVSSAELEVGAQLPDRHGVEHEVHGVEHPAELRREQHAPLLARDGAVPRDGGREMPAVAAAEELIGDIYTKLSLKEIRRCP